MKTKKALSFLLAVLLIALCAGCGRSGEDEKFDELTERAAPLRLPLRAPWNRSRKAGRSLQRPLCRRRTVPPRGS